LKTDLAKVEKGSLIELSTSSDPYPPIEEWVGLTRNTLLLLRVHGMKILITTKSRIVVRDVDIFSKSHAAVMITITTLDREVSRRLEPEASSPENRLRTVQYLKDHGVPVGVRIDPVIPGVNDDPFELKELVDAVVDAGAQHIVTSTYKAKWDSLGRLSQVFRDDSLVALYKRNGEVVHGSIYLPRAERARLLQPIMSRGVERGVTVATCRESLGSAFFRAPSCDGSHMIPSKRRRESLNERAGESSGA
jgi:DNA repair photolyase